MDQQDTLGNQGNMSGDPTSQYPSSTSSTSSTALSPATPTQTQPSTSTSPLDNVGDTVRSALQQAQQRTIETVDTARQQAATQINTQAQKQLTQAGEGLSALSDAASQASQSLRSHHQETLADYLDAATARIDQASDYLRKSTLSDLVKDTERLIERQPLVFVAGAFALGLLGARFLKSTSQGDNSSQGQG